MLSGAPRSLVRQRLRRAACAGGRGPTRLRAADEAGRRAVDAAERRQVRPIDAPSFFKRPRVRARLPCESKQKLSGHDNLPETTALTVARKTRIMCQYLKEPARTISASRSPKIETLKSLLVIQERHRKKDSAAPTVGNEVSPSCAESFVWKSLGEPLASGGGVRLAGILFWSTLRNIDLFWSISGNPS